MEDLYTLNLFVPNSRKKAKKGMEIGIWNQLERENMNEWVEKSIELANSEDYLFELSRIYSATLLPRRPLPEEAKEDIQEFYENGEPEKLIELLLKLTKEGHPFPVEHPYASILRQKPKLMERNPAMLELLGKLLLSLTIEDIIKGCERPIDLNRVMGQMFQNWLFDFFPNHGIPVLPEKEFESYDSGAFLRAKDAKILEYVNRELDLGLERGRDFLYKVGNEYVIGEARFLSTSGGSQSRDLDETIRFIQSSKEPIVAVGVLDGIVWFNRSYRNKLESLGDDEPALSALLLEDFLKSFG